MQNSDNGDDGQEPDENSEQMPQSPEDNADEVVNGGDADGDVAAGQPGAEAPFQQPAQPDISWEGEEFVHHQKSSVWYMKLFGIAVLFSGIIYFLTRDLVTVIVVVVGAIVFSVYASRKPRRIPYSISSRALEINGKRFPLGDFRSFSTVKEGSTHSIIFTPMKRFAPLATIFYPREREDEIVGYLTNTLPMTDFQHDAVDKLLHKIRF